MTGGSAGLVTLRLLRVPLALYGRSTEHFDELVREFALISLDGKRDVPSAGTSRPVPVRLLAQVQELNMSFAGFTAAVATQRDEAVARGEAETDLVHELPAAASEAARRLGELLDEVDEFCRSGQHLITLETPAEPLAFRRWFLGEFIEQVENGRAPVPWPDYVATTHPGEDWSTT